MEELKTITTYNCAIYVRVSTEKDSQSESPENQVETCRAVARNKSKDDNEIWRTPDHLIYIDKSSGTDYLKREEIQRMLKDAESGKFQIVIFKGISRFARDTEDALHMLRRLLATKVRVVSHVESYDSKTGNEFIFTIHAGIAQQVSEKISIDVTLGNRSRATNGKWNGIVPEGYEIDRETKRLKIVPEKAAIIQYIFDMFTKESIGTTNITQRLNAEGFLTKRGYPFERKKVYTILTNPVYIGNVVWGKRKQEVYYDGQNRRKKRLVIDPDKENYVVAENAHPPIIELSQFNEAQRILQSNKTDGRGRKDWIYLLSGRLRCNVCGAAFGGKVNHVGTRYYKCTAKVRLGASGCSSNGFRAFDLEDYVLEKIISDLNKRNLESIKITNTNKVELDDPEKQIKKIQDEQDSLTKQSIALLEKNISGKISDEMFDMMNKKIEEQVKHNNSTLNLLRNKVENKMEEVEQVKYLKDAAEKLMNIDPAAITNRPIIKKIVHRLVDKIVANTDGTVDIFLNFK